MKNLALLLIVWLCIGGCRKGETPVVKVDPTESLLQRVGETGHIAFKSWNGNLRGLDSDDVLHFYKDSKVVLEQMSVGVNYFEGSYDISPGGRVAVTLSEYQKDWPVMILRSEGDDLLLYREDGHTSWLPKGDPNLPDPQVDSFWPFRATVGKSAHPEQQIQVQRTPTSDP